MNVKEKTYKALKSGFLETSVSYFYPQSFNHLPAISYYEISQKPFIFADDEEYLLESQIAVSIWGVSSEVLKEMGDMASETMKKAGFTKVETKESYDKDNRIYEQTHMFKIIFNKEGVNNG